MNHAMPPPLVIGPHRIETPLLLAPMAGVTDRCFRILCRRQGAGLCFSEMTHSDPRLRATPKSRARRDHEGESAPIAAQIVGAEPEMLARAAQYNVAHGAQIIDINMGCPAKKVCRREAGSALMRDERLVARILSAVARAVTVPVTLKMRTGPAPSQRNAVRIARIAEDCGVRMVSVHGRTRADAYRGAAEFDTIAAVKQAVGIPVIANGDIDSIDKARQVLAHTGADGLMIGRAAQGRPWIFRELAAGLRGAPVPAAPDTRQVGRWLLAHVEAIHALYGAEAGVRIARKHIRWYCAVHAEGAALWERVCQVQQAPTQRALLAEGFGLDGWAEAA
ncbi:tRNA dihydrouridine synthase DusB [Algiphilus sp.]|uniref:tRNA dihydrouridine synthase DusB n=2 Tax=Algiphilus sp. TaxID=1872431 RepID=UPI0032EE3183|nr:tRNA dihydrouridine synthase DusB [Algiphilus sp.]